MSIIIECKTAVPLLLQIGISGIFGAMIGGTCYGSGYIAGRIAQNKKHQAIRYYGQGDDEPTLNMEMTEIKTGKYGAGRKEPTM